MQTIAKVGTCVWRVEKKERVSTQERRCHLPQAATGGSSLPTPGSPRIRTPHLSPPSGTAGCTPRRTAVPRTYVGSMRSQGFPLWNVLAVHARRRWPGVAPAEAASPIGLRGSQIRNAISCKPNAAVLPSRRPPLSSPSTPRTWWATPPGPRRGTSPRAPGSRARRSATGSSSRPGPRPRLSVRHAATSRRLYLQCKIKVCAEKSSRGCLCVVRGWAASRAVTKR